MEVNENLTAQETVHFLLARGVAQHQAFDCAMFVAAEVINVQVGEALHAVEYRIDETFKRSPFLSAVKRPLTLIGEISVGVRCHHTEEIFTAALFNERIPFEIEKNVAA